MEPKAHTLSEKWYSLTSQETLEKLSVSSEKGLTTQAVSQRQTQYGKNELPTAEGTSLLEMIIDQFKDVTVGLLILAAFISIAVGEAEDSIVILIIVTLNAAIGIYQERQAENALAALSKLQTPVVKVRRNEHVEEISATELVPGDIVLLEAGSSVPADGRLIDAINVKVDESAMTGESVASDKDVKAVPSGDTPPPIADRHNMVYMGTALTYGRAEMVVTDTGLKTQLGNIAALLQNVEKSRTPLQERLEKMGFTLAAAAITICIIVFIAGVLRKEESVREMFLTSVSLAVAAVPEGLPAIITVALALGANRMIKRHVLIRKLPAVETLGSVTTICSDKTGTLTRNEMTVTKILMPQHPEVSVTGVGYEPVGEFVGGGKRDTLHVVESKQLARIIQAAALCTDAYIERESEEGKWKVVGDTTEGALIVMAMKQGLSRHVLEENLPRVNEIPFTSERKSMTTFHQPVGEFDKALFHSPYLSFTKGAPDNLLEWASHEALAEENVALTPERRQAWKDQIDKLASQGIRVLSVAYREYKAIPTELEPEQIERNLILLGLIGIVDPPRREATEAVALARGAGIRPIMITGDHQLTAQAIAQQIGIIGTGDTMRAVSGAELDTFTPDQLQETVKSVSVYARVSPEHKLRIVEALQKNGQIVAMTGDGVNDAPALKQANIGVAMGITGTDVSKGAADMVLTDDNFASIVSAVEEGRIIYDNIRKFMRYLMGSNTGEIISMFVAIVIGVKLPLVATQILWVNLVTDGLPAIALGFEPAEPGVMKRKPRDPKESIFARGVGIHVLWVGAWVGTVTLLGYIYALSERGADIFKPDDEHLLLARSMAFFVLAVSQIFHVMAIHAGHASFVESPVWKNKLLLAACILTFLLQFAAIYVPFMNDLLNTTPLDLEHILIAMLLSASIMPAVEIEKAWWRRREHLAAPVVN